MEEEEMKEVLESFDSSLKILGHIEHNSRHSFQQKLDKITSELDIEEFSIDIDRHRTWNVIALLHFLLNDYKNAMEYVQKTMEHNPNNINSKIILAHCHLKNGEYYDCKEICNELEQLKRNEIEVLVAKAEMAFTYARFGTKMYERAENVFTKVCEESMNIEDVPVSYQCLWKFGLAKTMKRTLNLHNNFFDSKTTIYTRTHEERTKFVCKLLFEITCIQTEDTKASACIAKACAELGLIIDGEERLKHDLTTVVFSEIPPSQCNSEYFIKRALNVCPKDRFVLERAGKYFRYKKDINRSIKLLREAINIRSTSFGHHHLALSLKRSLEMSSHVSQGHVRQLFEEKTSEKKTVADCVEDSSEGNGDSHKTISSYGDKDTAEKFANLDRSKYSNVYGDKQDTKVKHTDNGNKYESSFGDAAATNSCVLSEDKPTIKHLDNDNEHKTDQTGQEGAKRMIKSPQKIIPLVKCDTTEEILHHLEIAFTLNENLNALYDKGLVLRALGRPEEAMDVFRKIINNNNSSPLQLANSYEQVAAYILEDTFEKDMEKKQINAKTNLENSVRIAFRIVENVPFLNDCLESVHTLKTLLLKQATTTQKLKELAFLYERMKEYKDAISCYKQIVEMEGSEESRMEAYLKLVKIYNLSEDYEEAVLYLDRIIMRLPEALHETYAQLYLKTYIEGGMNAFGTGDVTSAELRFRKALDYGKTKLRSSGKGENQKYLDTETDEEHVFDIFIYCDQSLEEKWRHLKDTFKRIGLHATLNSDDITPGTIVSFGMLENAKVSTHFVIAVESVNTELTLSTGLFTDQIIRIHEEKRFSNIVIVREDESIEIPAELNIFESAVFRPGVENTVDSDVSKDTLELLYKLASQRK